MPATDFMFWTKNLEPPDSILEVAIMYKEFRNENIDLKIKKILTISHILHPYCAIVFNNVALPHSSLIFSYTRHTQNTKEFWARLLQYRISMIWVKLILEKNDFGTRNFEINWSLNLHMYIIFKALGKKYSTDTLVV